MEVRDLLQTALVGSIQPSAPPIDNAVVSRSRQVAANSGAHQPDLIIDVHTLLKRPIPPDVFRLQYLHCRVLSFPNAHYFGLLPLQGGSVPAEQRQPLAIVNKKTCNELHRLREEHQVHFDATATLQQCSKANKEWNSNISSGVTIVIDVIIYGPREVKESIGQILSEEFETFLQAPLFPQARPEVPYENPHFLPLRLSSANDIVEGRNMLAMQAAGVRCPTQRDTMDTSEEVGCILDSLDQMACLRERRIDSRVIRSNVLRHQKVAIDFILRREAGDLLSDLRLWQKDSEDEECYQHRITRDTRSTGPEPKGGIIADEMGLGKTLVILATIAVTLAQAGDFVQEAGKLLAQNPSQQGKTACRATLIVAPSALVIASWIEEINKHTYIGSMTFHKHHGTGRNTAEYSKRLYNSDIVLTTYATIASEARSDKSILADIHWYRIVLDEAHDIRNALTKQFKAITKLTAHHRWCLTGTPIQNSLEDLSALVRFLRVPIMENPKTFRKYITSQARSSSNVRFNGLRTLLRCICLRRTRNILQLPEPVVQRRGVVMSDSERESYLGILSEGRRRLEIAVSGRRKHSTISTTALQSVLKLRLFCNNGILTEVSYKNGIPLDPDEALTYLEARGEATCVYCSNTIYCISSARDTDGGILIPRCSHLVCRSCLHQFNADKRKCPRTDCRAPSPETPPSAEPSLEVSEEADSTPKPPGLATVSPSTAWPVEKYPTKLQEYLRDIQQTTRGISRRKSITFSAWKKTLKLVSDLLTSQGIKHLFIHGSLSFSERQRVLKEFKSPLGADVLLMTLGTGAVGLNLAVAECVYLLEPQWNPAIEEQAIGRALRIGQNEQVTIIRYITEKSVEDDQVLERQKRKLQLIDNGFVQERLQNIMTLFGVGSGKGQTS
ncbi:hypothetical protein SAPIO_CDS3774 [Scedosporium apiospermum]|uniref:Uncharacterized protein n=1 Tax=Pseudallescheria apiosperma TaxID=563466 RepID=A0A084G9M8_PSEDA|nr:uncharacterized protein SAPIO_CDS3774 [Scedosporium apiospermum]KEZ44040.1 hypothetical protein SAPIO_CDS3774 [Scedosporium apiospermum]